MLETKEQHNTNCHCPTHNQHLCYMASQGFDISDPDEYQSLVSDPVFECTNCKRWANSDQNLCEPSDL